MPLRRRVIATHRRMAAEAGVKVRDSTNKVVAIHKHVAIIASEVEVMLLVTACVHLHVHSLVPLVGQLRSQLSHIRTSLIEWACP